MKGKHQFSFAGLYSLLTLWTMRMDLSYSKVVRPLLPLHRRMDPLLFKNTFYAETYDEVPEYEVVHVQFLTKRDIQGEEVKQVQFSAFGQDIHLSLQRNKDFDTGLKNMKLHFAENTENGIRYQEIPPEEKEDLGTSYHDLIHMAAVNIRRGTDGKMQMEGMIGDDLVIKYMPTEILVPEDGFLEDEVNLNFYQTENTTVITTVGMHIIYKNQERNSHSHFLPFNDKLSNRNFNLSSNGTSHRRTKRAAEATTVWPEIFLMVDYETYVLHGFNKSNIKRYFASFWNAVDLRYRAIENPKIRLCLTNIIIAKSKGEVPFIENNRLAAPNHNTVNAAVALDDLSSYIYNVKELVAFDIVVVMTNLILCAEEFGFRGSRCSKEIAGMANLGGACGVSKQEQLVDSVAIIKDTGGFSGIITAVHEVGHLLGSGHDGSPADKQLGGPDALECSRDDGYIMGFKRSEKGHQWSPCSVKQLKHFLKSPDASCLYNFPYRNLIEPRVLPGTILTLDEQCERDVGTEACFIGSIVCIHLFCKHPYKPLSCAALRPAAEGSFCGTGKICSGGKCIDKDVSEKSLEANFHAQLYKLKRMEILKKALSNRQLI